MIRCRWQGGILYPVGPYAMQAAREAMSEGDVVLVEIDHPRTMQTHKHEFAVIRDAFHHLPETLQGMPWAQTPETLRKHALIVTGYCHTSAVDCGSKAAAERVAAILQAQATAAHGYAIVQLRGPVVTLFTPESQSFRAMGKTRFQESKTAVLDWIAGQIGVRPEELAA